MSTQRRSTLSLVALAGILALVVSGGCLAANLLVNPSFEDGHPLIQKTNGFTMTNSGWTWSVVAVGAEVMMMYPETTYTDKLFHEGYQASRNQKTAQTANWGQDTIQ